MARRAVELGRGWSDFLFEPALHLSFDQMHELRLEDETPRPSWHVYG
jgi:hypothetical protein